MPALIEPLCWANAARTSSSLRLRLETWNASIPPGATRGPTDVPDPREAGTTQVEVHLPAELVSPINGARARARMALVFNRRPSDGQWLLVGARVFDAFAGTPVYSGPIW